MRGATHALAGLTIGMILARGAPVEVAAGLITAGALGALVPDLDHPQSVLSNRVGIVGLPFRILSHRGVTHSIVAAAAILLLAGMVPSEWRPYAIAAALGYSSHIVLDGLTISGVPLLWPWSQRFRLSNIRTGGLSERLFCIGLVVSLVLIYRERIMAVLSQFQ